MGVEIRPVLPEEMEEFKRVVSTALVIPVKYFEGIFPEWTLCAFEDGNLATSYAAWPLTMSFNGKSMSVAGVTTVGTLPVYRRRGYLRQITDNHFRLLKERGEQPVAALNASRAAIYQRYGYAVVATVRSYNIKPECLDFPLARPVIGIFRQATDDDFELLADLYKRFSQERTGYIDRSRSLWDAAILAAPRNGGVLGKVIYEENGESLGYVVYTLELVRSTTNQLEHNLGIRDLVWQTPAAYQAIWNYLSKMDLVASIIWGRVSSDDPLQHLIAEPRMLRCTAGDGLLARIVDIEKALPGRHYLEEGRLTFEVLDDLCQWNQGRWKLETSTDGTSINRTSESSQLVIPISTLAMLVFGQISATEAARMGRLDVLDYSALPLWDRVMRTSYRPFCPDMF